MNNKNVFIGVDAGSIAIKIAVYGVGEKKYIKAFHYGEPLKTFDRLLKENDLDSLKESCLLTGRYAELLSKKFGIKTIPSTLCLMNFIKHKDRKDINYIADIGSSGLYLVEVKDNKLTRFDTNSLCASGTGAFLDQQMLRMELNYGDIAQIPILDDPPSIATRCAVFAKSDLIHRQQEGYSVEQLWNGLVKGMAESAYSTLFRGQVQNKKALLIGGLTLNKIFVHYFKKLLSGNELAVPEKSDFFIAESAAYYYYKNPGYEEQHEEEALKNKNFEEPLTFDEETKISHTNYKDDYENEVDIWKLKENKNYNIYLGVDIGSTSTKLVALSEDSEILFGLYGRTQGKPIEAFKRLIQGINALSEKYKAGFTVKGLGTTGSGRKLVGLFAGADIIKNEITAHLKGALREFKDVKTIIEIGGQDSKYIFVEDGWMKDANMNYVCAAGTGSFVEEQAKNLNIKLWEIEHLCKDVKPPISSDRCTVFMEQDGSQLLIKGFNKREVMASILYSVCKNYINRVVGNRPIEEPVLFLGATAKNKGLVAAFQNILNKKIYTSRYSHLMGAIGAAEMLRAQPPENSKFKGFDIYKKPVFMREENCLLCVNKCRITFMRVEGEKDEISWGYMCGREPEDNKLKKINQLDELHELEKKINKKYVKKEYEKEIYIPKGLQYYSHYPFWFEFFSALNIKPVPSKEAASDVLNYGRTYSLADFCYPIKLAVGHTVKFIKDGKSPVFFPHHIQDVKNPNASNSYFCPLSQSLPSMLKSAVNYNELKNAEVLAPVIDFSKDNSRRNIKNLKESLGEYFNLTEEQIKDAYEKAGLKFKEFNDGLYGEAKKKIDARDKTKPAIVILGRAYNIYDKTLNLGIIQTIARYGYDIIPMDLLPVRREDIGDDFKDIYWAYGQKIIAAAKYLKTRPDLFPVYLTNFSCGPDSFLLTVVEEILETKPLLILELDEHGGDAGYITRLEAFFDRVENTASSKSFKDKKYYPRVKESMKGLRVYIPPMHPIGTRFMSAAFNAYSIDAVPLLKEDMETFAIGKAYVRGSECMPAASTIGSFLYAYENDIKKDPSIKNAALFMPCTSGPCRFGQYARLHDLILKRKGLDISLFSANSDTNYDDIKGGLKIHLLKAIIASDTIYKLGCRLRPYGKRKKINEILNAYINKTEEAIKKKGDIAGVLKELNACLQKLSFDFTKQKPLVGVVGEIYVRNSHFSNSDLIENIEKSGGEAWLTTVMEWLHYTAEMKSIRSKGISAFLMGIEKYVMHHYEKKYLNIFHPFLKDREEPSMKDVLNRGKKYLPVEFEGEAILTVGRAEAFIDQGAKLIVNVAPFGCMPGTISSAVLKQMSKERNIPAASMFYDGEADFNHILKTYIRNI